ncbi:MAG: OmpA family protein [Bacteroidetes bacterium]|nr:OmpA family protein [Bacteroidota bacterium]
MKATKQTLNFFMNAKFNLFFAFCLLMTVKVSAQQNLTLYNLKAIPQSNYINPGILPESRVNIGLPIISSLYLNKSNSGFKLNDLIQKGSNGSTQIDFANMIGKLSDNNYFALALQTDLLSANFKVKENYFSLNSSYKVNWRVRYPKDLLNFIWQGNGASLGEELHFNLGLDATTYLEYGLGYSREIGDKLSLGIRVKYLSGIANISTNKSDITLTTNPQTYDITATSDIVFNTSGIVDNPFDGLGLNDVITKLHNRGYGIDFGGSYKVNDLITVNASVLDLGSIKWNFAPTNYVSGNPNATFTYQGIDLNTFVNDSTSIDKAVELVFDSLNATFALDTLHRSYKTKLGPQIYAGAQYSLGEQSSVSLLLQGHFFDKKLHPALALSYNYKIDKYLNGSINYSMFNRSYMNIGLGLAVNLGPVQLYAVSDNVLGLFVYNKYNVTNDDGKKTSITYPGNTKNLNLRVGLNLTFGRKPLDKDKDGVVNKKDACPEIPGLVEFQGCPDKDGDKIPDKDDKCPDVAGLKEFFGCPDKDGDKIIDSEDNCPDVPGLAEFKGCPDKDGDKVIDKEDECPEIAGLVEFKGCPDKDGDKIPDKDDDCADIIGLAKFNGCPDADNDEIKDSEDRCPTRPGPVENKGCPEDVLYVLDATGKVIKFTTKGKDGFFHFESLPADGDFKFRLDGDGTETIDKLNILVGGVSLRATRMKDGFFKFEKIVPDESRLKEEKVIDVPIKLLKEEQEILKKAFDNLEFNLGKDIIRYESYASLDDLGKLLVKKSDWRLKLSGHTDNAGNAKANLLLSQKRAQAVKNFLVDRGIKADRIIVEYFGSSKPVADNKTEAGRQKNRRVEMKIIE